MNHPLLAAVIANNTELVKEFQNSHWVNVRDKSGFIPLEIAQFLGHRTSQQLLHGPHFPSSIKVLLKGKNQTRNLSLQEFEQTFNFNFSPYLTFSSYEEIPRIVRKLPYLLRSRSFAEELYKMGEHFREHLFKGRTSKISIRWIDDELGYGAFSEENLSANSFIGEYTGRIRRYYRFQSYQNDYCFRYPTCCTSFQYYVVDSLKEGNLLRFINHSIEPNLEPVYVIDRGILHLIFLTNKSIAKGSQLTFDYGKDYWLRRKMLPNINPDSMIRS